MMKKDLIAKPGICPICGASIYHYNNLEFNGDSITRDWECKCGATGSEAYRLEFIGHWDEAYRFEFCGHWDVYDKMRWPAILKV